MVLITGGLGYLGARIASYLKKSEKKVIIGVRSKQNFVPEELKDCEIVEVNMEDEFSLHEACKRVDTIIHLAGMNAQDCIMNPDKAILINSKGTLNLLNAARLAKVRNFIYFSTAHVYSSPLIGNITETSELRPAHPYSISNQIAEKYVLNASEEGSINCVIFRLTNAVGRPLNKEANCWSLVVNDLCKSAATIRKLYLNSSKLNQRDFISISDVCSVVLFFLNNKLFAKNGEIYNISSGFSTSLDDLTKIIVSRSRKKLGYSPEVAFNFVDKTNSQFDLSISNKKLKKLGFNPSGSIIDEIDDLLIHCKTWYQ